MEAGQASTADDALPARHFHAIDFGRGVAALAVIVWHYQHFFYLRAGSGMSVPASSQPLFYLLRPLYDHGYSAVPFFWLISGFVFAAVYMNRRTSTRDFIVSRIARLYPLHIITLVTVALLQILSLRLVGHEQIYTGNTHREFLLNLLFASHWGLGNGSSFNGPIWSVSVEVLVYAAFWSLRPVLFNRGMLGPLLIVTLCFMARRIGIPDTTRVLECAQFFFVGSAVLCLSQLSWLTTSRTAALALLVLIVGLSLYNLHPNSREMVGIPAFLLAGLISLCVVEKSGLGTHFAKLCWVGDSTYGIYLWHVPIQITVLIILDAVVGSRAPALSPLFLVGFLLAVAAVARWSFLVIELPARRAINALPSGRWTKSGMAPPAVATAS